MGPSASAHFLCLVLLGPKDQSWQRGLAYFDNLASPPSRITQDIREVKKDIKTLSSLFASATPQLRFPGNADQY